MGHAWWVQSLVAVSIILSALSRFNCLPDLMNMLLFPDVRWEGWEYGLVYLFVILKLLERFLAFNFKLFNAFIL